MKPKQLKILATALLMVCLGAVVSVTAQNPTTVCGYFSANIGFRVNTTCAIISPAFLTGPDRLLEGYRPFLIPPLTCYRGDRSLTTHI
jgi:hypothetical protein